MPHNTYSVAAAVCMLADINLSVKENESKFIVFSYNLRLFRSTSFSLFFVYKEGMGKIANSL